jgi:SAM-dependent methyltransferase
MGADEGRSRAGLMDSEIGGWMASANAWMASQGENGDVSRREILDPCLEKLLSSVRGMSVLDVGCGEGRYARRLALRGARVTGIDPVEAFILRARELHPQGEYVQAYGESLPFEADRFDIVLSYLSIVDIPDYRGAIGEMCRVVKSSGKVVLVTISNMASTTFSWCKDEAGRKLYRTVDRYMEEFTLDLEWSEIRILNYHRPLSKILEPFFEAGLVLDRFIEPLPEPNSQLYRDEFRVPSFQVMTFRFPDRLQDEPT